MPWVRPATKRCATRVAASGAAPHRISRAMPVAQANKSYTGMKRNDPKHNYSFFDKNHNRREDAT